MKPRDLANVLAERLKERNDVASVDMAGLDLSISVNQVYDRRAVAILNAATESGRSKIGEGLAVNVEFVSANPTGPLHAAHARRYVGDALANFGILWFQGDA